MKTIILTAIVCLGVTFGSATLNQTSKVTLIWLEDSPPMDAFIVIVSKTGLKDRNYNSVNIGTIRKNLANYVKAQNEVDQPVSVIADLDGNASMSDFVSFLDELRTASVTKLYLFDFDLDLHSHGTKAQQGEAPDR